MYKHPSACMCDECATTVAYCSDNGPRSYSSVTPEAAKKLAEMNMDQAVKIAQLEAMIQGLIDAQKPLLEEWAKLKRR